jgi:hypothetical protein
LFEFAQKNINFQLINLKIFFIFEKNFKKFT